MANILLWGSSVPASSDRQLELEFHFQLHHWNFSLVTGLFCQWVIKSSGQWLLLIKIQTYRCTKKEASISVMQIVDLKIFISQNVTSYHLVFCTTMSLCVKWIQTTPDWTISVDLIIEWKSKSKPEIWCHSKNHYRKI